MLAHLRFPLAQTRGRRYPESDHPYRNVFQRDRDRIIHSRAFRRLEAKTQVFSPGVSDHFRNRLTHTIEVAQIARTVANVLGLDEDMVEALALVHDIGHPPFAHAGEAELNRQMARFSETFDHNVHALRIVESFEQRYARFPGLNLTFEVREGIVKHSSDLAPGEHPELAEYLPELRPPIEAQLIDLADEIAYDCADLDDGYSAHILPVSEIVRAVPEVAVILETVETQYPGASEREQFQEALRNLINSMVSALIQGTAANAAAAGVMNSDDVRQHPTRIASFMPQGLQTAESLKHFLRGSLYCSPLIEEGRSGATRKMGQLFDYLLAHPEKLPDARSSHAQQASPHRAVCDYIAGMTDSYFYRMYGEIFGGEGQQNIPDHGI
jgi:dGTPase